MPGISSIDNDAEILETFTNEMEAMENLAKYKTRIENFPGYYLVKEYWVEICVLDEDGDFVDGGDIIDYSEMEINVINKENYEIVGTFGNYADAEEFAENQDYRTILKF